ncbi:MAG: hypothetical protein QM652_13985, partial [Legionella sp.]|uniref:hypothetical protein n=1 Tax=Legionella sp. TaxID=459 RepID=UPI0039E2725F
MIINSDNLINDGQNVPKVLSTFASFDELSRCVQLKRDCAFLATSWFACYYHRNEKISKNFIDQFEAILKRSSASFITAHQKIFLHVLSWLANINLLCDSKYLLKIEASFLNSYRGFSLKSREQASIIQAGNDFAKRLLTLIFDIEFNEFQRYIKDRKQVQNFPRAQLLEAMNQYFQKKPTAKELVYLANQPLVSIFLITGSGLFLERLLQRNCLHAIFYLFEFHSTGPQAENFLTLFKRQTKMLSVEFLNQNVEKYLYLIKNYFNELKQKNITKAEPFVENFADIIFNRWLVLQVELEKKSLLIGSYWLMDITRLFEQLFIMKIVTLHTLQNKSFANQYPGHVSLLQQKLLGLDKPDELLALGRAVIDGTFNNLSINDYGVSPQLIESLLQSEYFARNESREYMSALLRPVTSFWPRLSQYFFGSQSYDELYQRYIILPARPVRPLGQLPIQRNKVNPRQKLVDDVVEGPQHESVLPSIQLNGVRQSMLVSALLPTPGRKRSLSIEKADQIVQAEEELKRDEDIFNNWLLNRSHYKLTPNGYKHLKEFNHRLKSRMTSLLAAISSIHSGKVAIRTHGYIDLIMEKPISMIPVFGHILENMCKVTSPLDRLFIFIAEKKIENFKYLLSTFLAMDQLNNHFSALLTAYHYAEISDPSHNDAFFESLYN